MCGIAGFFGIRANRVLLETMNDLQAHRGPDGSGLFLENLVGLAHRRLSILDIDGGAQPIESKNGRYVIIHNGEVYNYAELRLELEALGKNFSTNTDTEVIVEAYDTWGDAVFDRFNGMWAFAIYDKLEERLVISRDHFGIKPIYFAFANAEPADAQQVVGVYSVPESSDLPNATAGSTLLFASEIMPILSTGLVEKRPNDKTIYRYLRFRVHDNSRETFFSGVEKLLPGEMLVIDKSGYEIRAYTRFRDELRELAKINKPYTDAARDQYLNMLTDSIRMRLQSDVTIGTSLSGGLDSSTVAVLIARLMNQEASATTAVGPRQNVFSAIFPGSINDEERYVDAATASCGDSLTVHKILPNADEFKQDIVEFVRTQEEPLISTGPYAQYKVMQQAAQHVKVLLDGQGADETMAGYIPYYFVYLRALRRQGQYLKMVREFLASFDILFRLGRFRLFDMLKFRKQIAFTVFLNPAFIEAHKNESFTVVRDDLKERLIEDVFENSIPSLLRYEDKNTMHFGLEGRVPFLDRELVSYVFSLSDEAIIKNGWNKRILRDSLRGTLPDMIAKRRNKIGFTTPEHEWFIRLKNYFYDISCFKLRSGNTVDRVYNCSAMYNLGFYLFSNYLRHGYIFRVCI
jgi:asparagine synthase (glutamine-hydrolysing)